MLRRTKRTIHKNCLGFISPTEGLPCVCTCVRVCEFGRHYRYTGPEVGEKWLPILLVVISWSGFWEVFYSLSPRDTFRLSLSGSSRSFSTPRLNMRWILTSSFPPSRFLRHRVSPEVLFLFLISTLTSSIKRSTIGNIRTRGLIWFRVYRTSCSSYSVLPNGHVYQVTLSCTDGVTRR